MQVVADSAVLLPHPARKSGPEVAAREVEPFPALSEVNHLGLARVQPRPASRGSSRPPPEPTWAWRLSGTERLRRPHTAPAHPHRTASARCPERAGRCWPAKARQPRPEVFQRPSAPFRDGRIPVRYDGASPVWDVGPGRPSHALALTSATDVIKVRALSSRRVVLHAGQRYYAPLEPPLPSGRLHHRLIRPVSCPTSCVVRRVSPVPAQTVHT